MEINTLLAYIDNGQIALPEFQRGYVWNREQVRKLFRSLYLRHPVGGLLVWSTESKSAVRRGDGSVAPGIVKLLLDGQQRITTIYGVVRGKPPAFFDGNPQTFSNLMFNLADEDFEFYQPVKMRTDPGWIDVTSLMQKGVDGLGEFVDKLDLPPENLGPCISHLTRLLGITNIDLHVDDVVGEDKSLDIVVDIFNRVNSGGTKPSKGDLALAKICAEWPQARETMKQALNNWAASDYNFDLDWLLRSVNTVLTGEAGFKFLHDKSGEEIQDGLKRAQRGIDYALNMIDGNLGLDHDRVLFGRFAVPVMVRYLDRRGTNLTSTERDKRLFWFVQAGMWGRFSSSTETYIDQDLEAVDSNDAPLDKLLEQLRLWHGGLKTEPGHFTGWSLGARFYPILYMLTRMGEARDWGSGLPLKRGLLGKMSKLEVHHIFPKSQLYKKGHYRQDVNALANFCFLTKDTNLDISDRLPEEYFTEIEANHPGALASQWIPTDPSLWRIEKYLEFLQARRVLLANETNRRMRDLLHGDTNWIDGATELESEPGIIPGGITSYDEEAECEAVNEWVEAQGLPRGKMSFDYTDRDTGQQLAVFDIAWPDGLQMGLTQPVALLLEEGGETIAIAAKAGYRCFTRVEEFKSYIGAEISPSVEVLF